MFERDRRIPTAAEREVAADRLYDVNLDREELLSMHAEANRLDGATRTAIAHSSICRWLRDLETVRADLLDILGREPTETSRGIIPGFYDCNQRSRGPIESRRRGSEHGELQPRRPTVGGQYGRGARTPARPYQGIGLQRGRSSRSEYQERPTARGLGGGRTRYV